MKLGVGWSLKMEGWPKKGVILMYSSGISIGDSEESVEYEEVGLIDGSGRAGM